MRKTALFLCFECLGFRAVCEELVMMELVETLGYECESQKQKGKTH